MCAPCVIQVRPEHATRPQQKRRRREKERKRRFAVPVGKAPFFVLVPRVLSTRSLAPVARGAGEETGRHETCKGRRSASVGEKKSFCSACFAPKAAKAPSSNRSGEALGNILPRNFVRLPHLLRGRNTDFHVTKNYSVRSFFDFLQVRPFCVFFLFPASEESSCQRTTTEGPPSHRVLPVRCFP